MINDGAVLLTAGHDIESSAFEELITAPIAVGDYAWIATNAVLLPGADIGVGSVVGAGAVVRGKVPPYRVAVGNPAYLLERRRGREIRNVFACSSCCASGRLVRRRRLDMRWLRYYLPEVIVCLAIIACVFEGALRKWLFRGSGGTAIYLCYFAKDILLAALILATRPRGTDSAPHRFRKILGIGLFLVISGAGISAVTGVNWVGAVLSLRALCFLPVVAYLAISRLAGMKLERLAVLIGCLTLGNAILGTVQYSSPAGAPVNYYAADLATEAAAFEGHVRSAGTFSYISGYGNMAAAGSWAGLTLLCLAAGRRGT